MKPKKYSEVNYIAMNNESVKEIESKFKIMTVLMYILILISLILSIKIMQISTENEALKQEKEALEQIVEIKLEDILKGE